MSDIATFNFNTSTIRVVDIEGDPWFVAADICRVLELHIQAEGKPNTTVALRKVGADEMGLYPIQTLGGTQATAVVSESGLYKLIMRSDKPQARPFQDWVTKVVLPAIRKDGGYVAGEEKLATGELDGAAFARMVDEMVQKPLSPSSSSTQPASPPRTAVTSPNGSASGMPTSSGPLTRSIAARSSVNAVLR